MDATHFEAIFKAHRKGLLTFFERRGCGAESEDLVQLTFLKAYNNLANFREEAGLREWLFIIARNLWKNSIRDRSTQKADVRKEVSLESSDMQWSIPGGNPLDIILKHEHLSGLQRDVLNALGELSPQMRQCMMLRVFQDLKYDRIAQVMRLNINTVKSHINQAKKKLRTKLDPNKIEQNSQRGA